MGGTVSKEWCKNWGYINVVLHSTLSLGFYGNNGQKQILEMKSRTYYQQEQEGPHKLQDWIRIAMYIAS